VVLPFPIWRKAFINDVDLASAQKDILNPHPAKTFSDKISLKTNPADMQIAKSYINCTEDTSLPHHYPWHPRLSQKLGLFRESGEPAAEAGELIRRQLGNSLGDFFHFHVAQYSTPSRACGATDVPQTVTREYPAIVRSQAITRGKDSLTAARA
jgi:hypothetical protein